MDPSDSEGYGRTEKVCRMRSTFELAKRWTEYSTLFIHLIRAPDPDDFRSPVGLMDLRSRFKKEMRAERARPREGRGGLEGNPVPLQRAN